MLMDCSQNCETVQSGTAGEILPNSRRMTFVVVVVAAAAPFAAFAFGVVDLLVPFLFLRVCSLGFTSRAKETSYYYVYDSIWHRYERGGSSRRQEIIKDRIQMSRSELFTFTYGSYYVVASMAEI